MVDNQGAMRIAENYAISERTKHMDLRKFFVQDVVENKQVKLTYVATEHNLADAFTKVPCRIRLVAHRELYGMSDQGEC